MGATQGLLAHLSLRDLLAARLVCRTWRSELQEVPSLNLVLPLLEPQPHPLTDQAPSYTHGSHAVDTTAGLASSSSAPGPGDAALHQPHPTGQLYQLYQPSEGQEPPYMSLSSTAAAIHLDEVRWRLLAPSHMHITAPRPGVTASTRPSQPGGGPSQPSHPSQHPTPFPTPAECPIAQQLAQLAAAQPRLTGLKLSARAAVQKQYSQDEAGKVGMAHMLWLSRVLQGWGPLAPRLRKLVLDVKGSDATFDSEMCGALTCMVSPRS